MRGTMLDSGSSQAHADRGVQVTARRLLAAIVALALPIGLLAHPVVARHDDGYSPIVPWHHERGVTVTTGTPAAFGSRWGACTDRLARAARRALDVTVTVDGDELPPAGWSSPVRPAKRISTDNFPRQCLATPANRYGSWIFWSAPVTFERPGTHRVRVTMTTDQRVDDGAAGGLPAGWSISDEITVIVVDPPPAGAFEPAGSLALARSGHTATLLPDGRVLITGGDGLDPEDLTTAEVWDPSTATFGPAEELAEPRPAPLVEAALDHTGHSATLLPDGRALVIGGTVDGAPSTEAELLTPDSGALVPAGILAEPRSGHTATFLRDGRVLVVGGTGPGGPLASAEVWTSATKPAKCLGKRPTLVAQPGVELIGSPGDDIIAGSVGDDLITGGGGNDRICGNGGDDTIDGGAGNDILDGGPGADQLTGAGGNDRLAGAAGDDTLDGGKGKDVCVGGGGTDWLNGCNDRKRTRGVVTITTNTKLKGPHDGRFVIANDGVTLDCDGHTVTGPGRRVHTQGVHLDGRKRVTVKNCHLRGFWDGFLVQRSNLNTFTGNRMSDVREGFILHASDGNRLVLNQASNVQEFGFALIGGSDRNRLIRNTAVDYGMGFAVAEGRRNTIADNVAKNGRANGFKASELALYNTFSGNTAIDNNQWGFEDLTTGYRGDAGTDNRYADNNCADNGSGSSSPETLCELQSTDRSTTINSG